MRNFVIVGDIDGSVGCLMRVCKGDKDLAEKTLGEIISTPSYRDYKNIRIEEIPKKDCWWNDSFLLD